MTHRSVHHRAAAVAVAAAAALVLGGCSTTTTSKPSSTSSPSTSSSSSAGSAAPSDSSSSTSAGTDDSSPAALPPAPTDPLAAAAWTALLDEHGEYASFAAYDAVIEKFGELEPYLTIRDGESRHISALTRQLERFGVTAPENPWLGRIPAPDDLRSAARAWAEGEVENVAMYDRLLPAAEGDRGMTRVLTNLRRASQDMHLPLFTAAADKDGTLTKDEMLDLGVSH